MVAKKAVTMALLVVISGTTQLGVEGVAQGSPANSPNNLVWTAFKVDLTKGPVEIDVRGRVECGSSTGCFAAFVSFYASGGSGHALVVRSNLTPFVSVSSEGEGYELFVDYPFSDENQGGLATGIIGTLSPNSTGGWFVGALLLDARANPTVRVEINPPERQTWGASGNDGGVLRWGDFDHVLHADARPAIQAGALYRKQVSMQEGFLGYFVPSMFGAAAVWTARGPNVFTSCGASSLIGIGCEAGWTSFGPSGTWSFLVLAQAELGLDRPVLLWVDTRVPF